jgi:hypothetical protein
MQYFKDKRSIMPKEAVFTMKLEPELRAEFIAEGGRPSACVAGRARANA